MFLPTYTTNASMTLPKYQSNEDYGYVIDILDYDETQSQSQLCHIDDSLCDKPHMPVSPYTIPSFSDHNLVHLEEGRANESYMTKARKMCCGFIQKLWKK